MAKMYANVARGGGGSGFDSATSGAVHASDGLLAASVARNGMVHNNTDTVGNAVMGDGKNLANYARNGDESQPDRQITTQGGTRKGFVMGKVIG